MTSKLILILFALLAIIQFIKPIGLPGLRRRRDAWRLVVLGVLVSLAALMLVAGHNAG